MKNKLINIWDDSKSIYLLYKDQDKKKVKIIRGFNWYFVILLTDYKKIPIHFWEKYKVEKILQNIEVGEKYVKLFCDKSIATKTITSQGTSYISAIETLFVGLKRMNIELFEADLSLSKRYMIDNYIEIETDLSTLFFDIETDGLKGIEIGRDRILSFAACDNNGKIYFESGDEKELLSIFLSLIEKYDIISGWNSEKFDRPYIETRMALHQLTYDWRRNIHVDLMQRCIKLYHYDMDKIGLTGFSLNEVSRVFLNEQKIDIKMMPGELYRKNFEQFKEYNIKDVTLLYKLDQKLNIIDLMKKECEWTGTFLNRFFVGELLDNYMLRESKKSNLYLATRPSQEETLKNQMIHIIGGYVMEPLTGLYSNVRIMDFKSLYPSIIVGWNIGQDSLDVALSRQGDIAFNEFIKNRQVEDLKIEEWLVFLKKEKERLDPDNKLYQTTNNNFFQRQKQGFMSQLVKNLLELRKEYKERQKKFTLGSPEHGSAQATQWIVKELANSMFGVNADRRSRYFNKNIAESITITGQFLNKLAAFLSEELKYDVIYSDTDSIFVLIDDGNIIENTLIALNKKIKKILETTFKLSEHIVHLEYDKKYGKMILLDKKRYTGIITWANNKKADILFSRGTEDARRNTIKFAKQKMIELILMIVKENRDIEYIKKWLTALKKNVLNDKFKPENISISTKIAKPTYKYKSKPVHVRLAEKMIDAGELLQPSESKLSWAQITYIVISSVGGIDAVLLKDFDGKWDRFYYWNVQIYKPLHRLLSVVYKTENWDRFLIPKNIILHPNQLTLF